MGLVSAARILRAPGSLIVNPAGPFDDPDDAPFGGTVLGNVMGVYLMPFDSGFTVWAEEFGEPADQLEPLRDWAMGGLLRGWDDDAVGALFQNVGEDPISRHTYVTLHGGTEPGMSAYDERRTVLLFLPENPKDVPCVLAFAAVPMVEESAQVMFTWGDDLGLPAIFRFFRDSQGRIAEIRRFWDLTTP